MILCRLIMGVLTTVFGHVLSGPESMEMATIIVTLIGHHDDIVYHNQVEQLKIIVNSRAILAVSTIVGV